MSAAETATTIHAAAVDVDARDASVPVVGDVPEVPVAGNPVSDRGAVSGAGLVGAEDLGGLVGVGWAVAAAPLGCAAVVGCAVVAVFGVDVPVEMPGLPGVDVEPAPGGAASGTTATGAGTAPGVAVTGATGSAASSSGAGAGSATGAVGVGTGAGPGGAVGAGAGSEGAGSEGASPGAVALLSSMQPSATLIHPGLQVLALAGAAARSPPRTSAPDAATVTSARMNGRVTGGAACGGSIVFMLFPP